MDGGIDMLYTQHFGWGVQERLQEVIALHQHASDECETLRVIFPRTLFVS